MLRNRFSAAFAICLTGMVCLFSGCGSGDTYNVVSGNVIYCLDSEEESLESEAYSDAGGNPDESIDDCLALIEAGPSQRGHKKLLTDNVVIQNYSVEDGNVTIDFSKEYLNMERPREVLVRAGIVRSLMQVQGVGCVSFTVNGAPIRDSKGQEIGAMTSDTFIENAGRQINTYSHASINLYYASEDGKHLKKESRSIFYSSSKLLEWAVVERLISGPKAKGSRLAIPSNVQILSVSTSEGVCYVNLDSAFQANILTVSSEVTLYSIVNSLVEDCNVSAVQFSINGESDVEFDEGLSLKKPFEADMSLVID